MIVFRIAILLTTLILFSCTLCANPSDDMSIVRCEGDCYAFNGLSAEYLVGSDESDFMLPDTVQQKLISTAHVKNRTMLRVICTEREIKNNADNKSNLAKTRLINTDNPLIIKFASAVKTSSDPLQRAEQIVYETISDKRTGIPLASTDEILSLRAGDCTEHTVLLLAILRAAKIPSRAVVGVFFVPSYEGRSNVFVFHMWAEAFYNGRWQLVDAAFPGKKIPGRYISLAYHSMKSSVPLEYLAAVATIRNLTIRRVK
jgi:hypothetical protein